ncbi:MAG TPA: NAD(P)-dependent oxidoreductase [Chloroflexota bacterium]
MRVLITGASGFVGSFTAAHFARAGHEVTGLDLRIRPIDPRHAAPPIRLVEADIRDPARVRAVAEECRAEGIVHAAAVISQTDGANDPLRMYRINVDGTMSVLEAARALGARVVYVATATLYGIHPDLHPLSENARPEPVGIYDTTKLMAETMVISYHKVYGLDTVSVRPGYVWGPGSSTGGYFMDQVYAGQAIDQPQGAELPMDMTYVRDLADGIGRAMTVRPIEHRIFNVTGGVLRRREEVAEAVRRRVPGAQIRLGPGIPARAHLRGPSLLDRARAELGYEPRYMLENGMDDWLAWLKAPVPVAP